MRIGELAGEADVGVETVRFYEQRGLIDRPARPASGGYRDYPDETVRRIRFIRSAQRLGFSLAEVAELLELDAGDGAQCIDVRERAILKRAEVQAKIANLNRMKAALNALIDACPGAGPVERCSILEAIHCGETRSGKRSGGKRNGEQKPRD